MTTREELIGNIIKKRQPFGQSIEQVENKLKEYQKNLKELENLRILMIPKLDEPTVSELFKKLSLDNLQKLIDEELKTLQKLKLRFKRSTINIGVVGRARQGKSRFLQSVSGLTRSEIPDGDREHCTGVRSTIYHKQDGSQKTHGLVWFHTEESFLEEIIKPYYEQLSLGNLPNIQDFAQNPLPELPEKFRQ
jgi:ATPase subunit of ABC transporter with duplicated ATPase domains